MLEFLLGLKNSILAELAYILLFFIPSAAVVFTFYRKRKRDKAEVEVPFDEIRRRPAGESIRLEIERLTEQIDPWLITLVIIPAGLAMGWSLTKQTVTGTIVIFLFCAVASIVVQRRLAPLVKRRAAYRLGFHGERFVAEELNQLMADGFRVFHDVPFEKYNIDHVVVGRTGVFVVETKTRRKRLAHGKQKHKVSFDGSKLQFPSSWDDEWLHQSRLNARSLSQWLRSSAAETVAVKSILTIPGWLITRTGKSDVNVLNPKEIRGFVLLPAAKPLDDGQIQRITHQLEEKCKLAVD